MAELKTRPTGRSVQDFLDGVEEEGKRRDCFRVMGLMKRVTGAEPALWGDSLVGFGSYHYVYQSGREGDWFLTGFSPRKQNLAIYIMGGLDRFPELMSNLGKYKNGKSCLYVKKLDDIDLMVLEDLIRISVERLSGE